MPQKLARRVNSSERNASDATHAVSRGTPGGRASTDAAPPGRASSVHRLQDVPATHAPNARSTSSSSPAPVQLVKGGMPANMQNAFDAAKTREELAVALSQFHGAYGRNNAASALEKTNHKYMLAKRTPFAEHPDAEHTAVRGMASLMVSDFDHAKGNDWKNHKAIQAKDSAFHTNVVNQPHNPYGLFTTGVTKLAPVNLRAAYSAMTAYIPPFFRS